MKEKKKLFSRLWDLPYGRVTPYHLFDASKNSKELVQRFQLQQKIPVHTGCVNTIAWNENGRYLLSGSDDKKLAIVQGYDYSVLAVVHTAHSSNIFSAKFLPCSGDSHVVSSSGDGLIIYSDLERPDTSMTNKFTCHKKTSYEIMTLPSDPNTFLSCGEDKTVRWIDIRTKTSCLVDDCKDDILITCRDAVSSIAINPLIPYQLAVGCGDSSVQIFDRRMLSTRAASGYLTNGFNALMSYFTVPDFPPRRRITSLCYSGDGREMLVSYSSDYIYLFDVKDDMGKKPKILTAHDNSSYQRPGPLMKRLRVRGDWSDTGPNSRPETEIGGIRDNTPNNLVRRMTDILTRMLFSSQRTSSQASSSSEQSPLASFPSEDGDQEGPSDSNNEEAVRESQSAETNNESSTTQGTEQNESSSQSVSVVDAKNTGVNNDSSANKCALQQTNVDCQPSSSVDLTSSTSGFQTTCKNTTVIKDSVTQAVNPELTGQKTLSSSPLLAPVRSEDNLTERQISELNSSHVENVGSPNEQNLTENVNNSSVNPTLPTENTLLGTSSDNVASVERSLGEESETEAAVQSIQPSPSVPTPSQLQSPRSPSPELIVHNAEEVELMMEVDSWDSDSDEGTVPDSPRPDGPLSNRNQRRRGRVSSSCDEFDVEQKDEVRREKAPKHVKQPCVKKMFIGHRNARTMIKESTFWGDNFVMSGSDCGHIFIWDRHTTELVMVMEADHHVVNCLQPHPFDPILASSGIDYDIKIWAPLKEEPFFDAEHANEIVKRNEIMLEVTRDTITVPASFMFNMFNTLNHLRNGHRQLHRWSRAARASGSSDSSNR